MQFATNQLSTQVLNPTTESKRAVTQFILYLKGTHNTCRRLEPHMMVPKSMIEFVGQSDSRSETHQRAKVLRDVIAMYTE